MSTKYDRNFTNFQNVSLGGTNGPAMIEAKGSVTNGPTTIAVEMISGSTVGSENGSVENPYLHVANAGLSVGTGYIRYVPFGGSTAGTLSVNTNYNDTDRAWVFPSKSGTFPIAGTFAVDMPAVGAGAFSETAVTVSGIRVEDGIIATVQNTFQTVTTSRGHATLTGANAQNGYIYLTFFNFGTTATIPEDSLTVAYCAVR